VTEEMIHDTDDDKIIDKAFFGTMNNNKTKDSKSQWNVKPISPSMNKFTNFFEIGAKSVKV
jgi:hypothetical protein